jgi:hypothetical protein
MRWSVRLVSGAIKRPPRQFAPLWREPYDFYRHQALVERSEGAGEPLVPYESTNLQVTLRRWVVLDEMGLLEADLGVTSLQHLRSASTGSS